MGEMIIYGLQNLKHANGASDSVTVSVFVWAEDVVLSIPTANEPGALSPQFGEMEPQAGGDEYGTGMISKPANIIAKAAGALSNAPGIGLYARATQIGASAIANIAKAFGYSRPNDISSIQPFRPTYVGNMANANLPDSATKLTYDAKQELTCDTRTFGLDGTDEMTIKSIACRESWLTEFPWTVAAASETLLWNSEVNPQLWNTLSVASGPIEYHMPACCFAKLPFRHWRGTMKFRFQIVASSFHKGRLKITYDPSYPLTNEYNTNYTRVIDIAEERDFTVEIGWGQQTPYLESRQMLNSSNPPYGTTALGGDPGIFANGIISLYVVNELTVPNSTANNDISVNVFVSMGDDFEVINPDDNNIRDGSWFAPQFGELVFDEQFGELPFDCQAGEEAGGNVPDSDNTQMENAPMKEEPDETMAPMITDADHTTDVFFGDPITSVRQILKRYMFSRALCYNATASGYGVYNWCVNNFPLHRGYAPDGVNDVTTPSDPTAYTFSKMTMLNWFTPAYVCYRGGIKWKYQQLHDNRQATSFFAVMRNPGPDVSYVSQYHALDTISSSVSTQTADWDAVFTDMGHAGLQVTDVKNNGVVEVEIPFQQPYRFGFGKQGTLNLNLGTDSYYHWVMNMIGYNQNSHSYILSYVAAGEDFTLGFYVGPPVLYYQPNPTPSATA
jgi:hypothetical protein